MIRLKAATDMFQDCTQGFTVILDKNYTVKEFIDQIVKQRRNEWGYFRLKMKKDPFGKRICEYRNGEYGDILLPDILNRDIEIVSAHGGWSAMDYIISLTSQPK